MFDDLTVQLLSRGYEALPRLWDKRYAQGDSPGSVRLAAPARLMGHRALVVRGPEGAALFYDESLVERSGVVPKPLANLLFGPGAVHGLDGEPHRCRKDVFLGSWGAREVQELGDLVEAALVHAVDTWPGRLPVRLHTEFARVYGEAVLQWVGVEEDPGRAALLSLDMARVVDGFGGSPVAYLRGVLARRRLDRWATGVVTDVRAGRRPLPASGILRALADGDGADLEASVAGVEMLNVLRPTVAVSWWGVYAAGAILSHPEHGRRLADGGAREARLAFAQEVRRLAPFVPALAGRLRRDLTWGGVTAAAGDRVVLDVPGINRDPRAWPQPGAFLPARFVGVAPGPFDLVPQGGGPPRGHRCPGEDVALTILDRTLLVLSRTGFSARGGPTRLHRIPAESPGGLMITEVGHLVTGSAPLPHPV